MTIEIVTRLILFNVVVGVFGAVTLVAITPGLSARTLVRLGGLALMVGYAATMVIATLALSVGLPVTPLSFAFVAAGIGALAARRRRTAQTGGNSSAASVTHPLGLTLLSAVPLGLAVIAAEAIFRRGRLEGLLEFDGWNSWGPKASELFYTGSLDPELLESLPGGSYPPGLPSLLGLAMHAMGSADVVTIHLQYAFFALAFVWAWAGSLLPRTEPLIVAPFVLLALVMPDPRGRSVELYGDLPLGYALAVAALLVLLWVLEEWPGGLGAPTLLLAGAAVTKREALVFVAAIFLGAAIATAARRRVTWPRIGLAFAGVVVAPAAWSVWLRVNDLRGNGLEDGLSFLTDVGRLQDSATVVIEMLFQTERWLLTTTFVIAALTLAAIVRAWPSVVFVATAVLVSSAGCVLILWSTESLALDDTNAVARMTGSVVLIAVTLTPILLHHAWHTGPHLGRSTYPAPHMRRLAFGLVLVAAVAYPARIVAGGLPTFPGTWDCETPVRQGSPALVVLGDVESYPEALDVARRAREADLGDPVFAQNGCGGLRVRLPETQTVDGATRVAARAREAGFDARIEGLPAPTG